MLVNPSLVEISEIVYLCSRIIFFASLSFKSEMYCFGVVWIWLRNKFWIVEREIVKRSHKSSTASGLYKLLWMYTRISFSSVFSKFSCIGSSSWSSLRF